MQFSFEFDGKQSQTCIDAILGFMCKIAFNHNYKYLLKIDCILNIKEY